jgi:NAD(P)-dependent dehydrogenase (short-subunit alcohol dehydrogenase family)
MLEDRIALVTGAGGTGMGRSIALTLARDGADVVVNYRKNAEGAAQTVAAVESLGRRAVALPADVSDSAAVAAMFERARAELGDVDIVVNSAGGPWKPQDITEIDPEHLRAVLSREIDATFYLLREALPYMRARGWGRFVSIGGHRADDWPFGPPDAPFDYPLGKAARHWLTRTLAAREHGHGITINAVAPGPTARFTFDEALAALTRDVAQPSPAVSSGDMTGAVSGERSEGNTPQDMAELIAFLCSDEAARITGAVIPVPGARPV